MAKSYRIPILSITVLFFAFSSLFAGSTEHINVVKSANYRDVRVELTYQIRDNQINNPRIKISKSNKAILEEAIDIDKRVIFEDISLPIADDIDGDWEPEIIVNLALNTKGELNESIVYFLDNTKKQYKSINHSWHQFLLFEEINDVNSDGIPEIITLDHQFHKQFSQESEQDTVAPIKIWTFKNEKFVDNTKNYKDYVYQHALNLWEKFDEERKADKPSQKTLKLILASYLADKYSLEQSEDGWKRLKQAYQFEDSEEYFNSLKELLEKTHYSQ
ncbi:MAG: hypothetical protein QNJ31_02725 [Candidatus Caenarcaniphilales bacterium]|nr:hypothetical protein [Candidatus Caenarcaniphilales bacterium]